MYTNTIILQSNVMLEFADNDADTLLFRISKIFLPHDYEQLADILLLES